MKKSTKRLLTSLGFLAIALIVTTTTTFAWFSFNEKVTVTGISATVTAKDGLFISTTENGVYGTSVNFMDCTVDGTTTTAKIADLTYELADLTSANGDAILNKTGATATAAAKAIAAVEGGSEAVDAVKGQYVEFAFWLKSSSEYTMKLDLTSSSVTSQHDDEKTPDIKAWGTFAADTYSTGANGANHTEIAQGSSLAVAAANAVRMSIKVGTATTNVWEPNADKGYNSTTKNLAEDYNKQLDASFSNAGTVTPATTFNDDTTVLGAVNHAATKVSVKIWLEGTDGDCFNAILSDAITATLALVGTYVAA